MSQNEIGKLASVIYDTDTQEISAVFKITNPEYRDFVLRWARQKENQFVIRGEQLLIETEKDAIRTSGRRVKDADV